MKLKLSESLLSYEENRRLVGNNLMLTSHLYSSYCFLTLKLYLFFVSEKVYVHTVKGMVCKTLRDILL